jgi:toxin ParE1/3/4
MTKVVVLPRADAEMDEIVATLTAERGPATGMKYALEFAAQIELIRQFPKSTEARPRWGRNVRRALALPYVMIYTYDPTSDLATLLCVLHGKRCITRKLIQS